ncbi:MAG: nitrite reductase small subunit NirD [Mycobacteriales bacterium]
MSWFPVLPLDRLPVDRGVCVLVDGEQVALVRTARGDVYAVDNQDPVTGAMVMSRGIVGSRGDRDVLVSPLLKHAFDLSTGECLDQQGVRLSAHDVRVVDGRLEVGLAEDVRRPA